MPRSRHLAGLVRSHCSPTVHLSRSLCLLLSPSLSISLSVHLSLFSLTFSLSQSVPPHIFPPSLIPLTFTFCLLDLAAPSEPPQAVGELSRQKRSLSFGWNPPSCPGSRGLVLGYAFLLRDLDWALEDRTGQTDRLTRQTLVEDLVPYTRYAFQVLAYTIAGNGPYSSELVVRTDQASTHWLHASRGLVLGLNSRLNRPYAVPPNYTEGVSGKTGHIL